jgi:hypothetical protein
VPGRPNSPISSQSYRPLFHLQVAVVGTCLNLDKDRIYIMAWTEINLEGISTEMERLPEGNYVFELLPGAVYNKWDNQKVDVAAKVSEGEFTGRVNYFSYPDPAKQDWSPQAFKRLEIAIVKNGGEPIVEGEDPVAYLNKETSVGKKFIAKVTHREFTNKDGEKETKVDLKTFSVKAVPVA